MQHTELLKLNRDVRTIAERLPNNAMSSRTERLHVSDLVIRLTTEVQRLLDKAEG